MIGDADSQGDDSQRTDTIREYLGLNGTGLSIGIISNSFDYAQTDLNFTVSTDLATDILSGDLPGIGNPFGNLTPVNVVDEATFAEAQSFTNGNIDEGRAMAQIVHDVAQGAAILFANGAGGQGDFANNIATLANAGAGVIVIDGATTVQWRAGVVDAVFDLLGDFTGDGIIDPDDGDVDGLDYLAWMRQLGRGTIGVTLETYSADGDDDGDVDGDDLAVWQAHFGSRLQVSGVFT